MRLCDPCWAKLRAAIDARGLTGLVKTARGVHAEMVGALEGKPSTSAPDPLVAANNAIWSNALRIAGFEVMTPNEDGSEKCPLCYLVQNCGCGRGEACPFLAWIERAADDALAAVAAASPGSEEPERCEVTLECGHTVTWPTKHLPAIGARCMQCGGAWRNVPGPAPTKERP